MRARLAALLTAMLVILLLSSSAVCAQYQPGDMIIGPGFRDGSSYHLIRITPTGSVSSIKLPYGGYATSIMMSPDNRAIWVTGLPGLYQLAPDGTHTTITFGHNTLIWLGVDGNGGVVGYESGHVLRIDRSRTLTTVYSFGTTSPNFLGLDEFAGGLVYSDQRGIWRLNLTGTASPIPIKVWSPPLPKALFFGRAAYDPGTDFMLGGMGELLTAVRIRRGFHWSSVASLPTQSSFRSAWIDPVCRAAVIIFGGPLIPRDIYSEVQLRDLNTLAPVRTIKRGAGIDMAATHFVLARNRHVGAVSPARRGGVFAAMVSFPNEPGTAYAVGYSFGMRPGIAVPDGRRIYLQRDSLLTLSLTHPTMFPGGQGVLDAAGEAVARMRVPNLASLSGLRVFAVAVTIANNQIRTISAPLGVSIQ